MNPCSQVAYHAVATCGMSFWSGKLVATQCVGSRPLAHILGVGLGMNYITEGGATRLRAVERIRQTHDCEKRPCEPVSRIWTNE